MENNDIGGPGFYGENGMAFQNRHDHIIENVKRTLTTVPGQRINNFEFGSMVRKYLFLPTIAIDDVLKEIKDSVERCVPEVIVEDCSLTRIDDNDTIEISLELREKSTGELIKAKQDI